MTIKMLQIRTPYGLGHEPSSHSLVSWGQLQVTAGFGADVTVDAAGFAKSCENAAARCRFGDGARRGSALDSVEPSDS